MAYTIGFYITPTNIRNNCGLQHENNSTYVLCNRKYYGEYNRLIRLISYKKHIEKTIDYPIEVCYGKNNRLKIL